MKLLALLLFLVGCASSPSSLKKSSAKKASSSCGQVQQVDDFVIKKNQPAYWNALGVCAYQRGKLKQAEMLLTQSLSLQKNFTPALNNLSVLAAEQGDFEKSLALLSLAQDQKVYLINQGNLLLSLGDASRAKKIFQQLKQKSGYQGDILTGFTIAEYLKYNTKAVLQLLNSRKPVSTPEALAKAASLVQTGKREEAIKVFEATSDDGSAFYKQIKQRVRGN